MRIQEWIYQLEVGGWGKYLKTGAAILMAVAILVLYNFREFKNFSNPEAMDVAQLARNISEGEGYTTDFVRPLSIHLLVEQRVNPQRILKEPHPDLANPPVYPYLLAGLMKVLPFDYDLADERKFSSFKYQPERLIAWSNQLLFLVSVFLVYRLGARLFDKDVGFLSAVIFFGAELFWRFSVSGLSTMLLVLIFLLLVNCLIGIEQSDSQEEGDENAEARRAGFKPYVLALCAGLLLGLGALTRYSFAWMVIPVVVFLIAYSGSRRWAVTPVTVIVFLMTFTPWLVRNHNISGHFFGTAGFAVMQGTGPFEADRLERSLGPDFGQVAYTEYVRKFVVNFSEIIREDLPVLGGSWVMAFFLVSLLVAFRNRSLNRLRIFLVISFVVLTAVQAMGRTNFDEQSPVINSGNILVLLVPLAMLYGVSLFLILLEQLGFEHEGLDRLIKTVFVMVVSAPLLLTLLPPRTFPLSYPPYHPPRVQEAGSYFDEDELIATDMPWALAWYGNRQSVWITLTPDAMLDEIDSLMKPIRGLYLTELTLDRKFISDLVTGETAWGKFVVDSLVLEQIPDNFPLKQALSDYLPYQFLLADRRRW